MMAIADMIIAQIITAMEINGGDGGRGDKEPSPSYYVKPKALIYKGLRQLTISLYLSKQS